MISLRKEVLEDIILVILALFLLFFVNYINSKSIKVKDEWYEEKLQAAFLMEECLEEVKRERLRRNIPINKEIDIRETGLIGFDITPITTTLGSLEAKRTSINPDFAAVVVDMMKNSKLKPKDSIAVNFSGSFPALNIAVLCASEVLDLNPIIISSIGASTWGANIPGFTYMDMENLLYQKGLINNRSLAISRGGAGDLGKDMDKETIDAIVERARGYGLEIITEENLKVNISKRYDFYRKKGKNIKAFINVGGNIISLGTSLDTTNFPPGIIIDKNVKINEKSGLIQLFLSRNIPVIHLLNIKKLALDYGLPVDPSLPIVIGDSDAYYTIRYNMTIAILTFCLSGFTILLLGKKKREINDCYKF